MLCFCTVGVLMWGFTRRVVFARFIRFSWYDNKFHSVDIAHWTCFTWYRNHAVVHGMLERESLRRGHLIMSKRIAAKLVAWICMSGLSVGNK
jgi:hypothetical protein